jgi:membrane protein required for colicin V production
MNWADWTIIAVIGLSVWIGAARGFVREALSLAIWVAAFATASMTHQAVASLLTEMITTPSLRMAAAWLAVFVAVLLVGAVVGFLFGRLVAATGLTGTDRLLGTLFGVLRGVAIVMLVLIFAPKLLPVDQDPWWRQSALIPQFLRFEDAARQLAGALFGFFKQLF